MKKPAREPSFNPVLAENFNRLIEGVSVGKLREAIGGIGTSAIQSAKLGSTGLRLETLEKIAAHFEIEPHQLLLPKLGKGQWPLKTLSYAQFVALPEQFHEAVENFARPYVKSSQTPVQESQRAPTVVTNREQKGFVFVDHKLRVDNDGTGNSDQDERTKPAPRKSAGHR